MATLWGAVIPDDVEREVTEIRDRWLASVPNGLHWETSFVVVLPYLAWCVREVARLREAHRRGHLSREGSKRDGHP
jgi:hypothetical protein